MERRDLYEVQRLMLEMQLPPRFIDHFPALAQVLASVQQAVCFHEESVIYVKNWVAIRQWGLDFKSVEMRRRRMLAADHPCILIQPFVDEVPIAGEGSEDGASEYGLQDKLL